MPLRERRRTGRRYLAMRPILLVALILGACQSPTVDITTPVASASTTVVTTSTSTPIPPSSTSTTPLVLEQASLYPYQSAAAIAEALSAPLNRSEDFDWGLDYVKWVVGWDEAVSYDGTDGTDQWGTFYRSSQDDTIYVLMGILGYNPQGETVVGLYQATTFFDAEGYDLTLELREAGDGWALELTPPPLDSLDLPPGTVGDVLVQFESASYESDLAAETTTIRMRDEPHTWGILQIAYRDPTGHAVGWHALVIDP